MEALTVHEVSKLAGISVRTLHHYDKIGLLTPATRTDAGYRLYSEADLARLQQILLFRELEFPLDEIRGIIDNPAFNRAEALKQQIQLPTEPGTTKKLWSTLGQLYELMVQNTQVIAPAKLADSYCALLV